MQTRITDYDTPLNKKRKVPESTIGESIWNNNIPPFPLQKIISGGQTGADRGALEAAEDH